MTIFTPYMNADLYQHTPEWQKIERYDYCSQVIPEKKTSSVFSRMKTWFHKEEKGSKAA